MEERGKGEGGWENGRGNKKKKKKRKHLQNGLRLGGKVKHSLWSKIHVVSDQQNEEATINSAIEKNISIVILLIKSLRTFIQSHYNVFHESFPHCPFSHTPACS